MAMVKNVTHRLEGRKVVIEIDLDKGIGPSKSGKTDMIARAMFVPIEGEPLVKFTLSMFREREDGEPRAE